MKKLITLPHLHSPKEVANLLQVDLGIIDRLIRLNIHPERVWMPKWKQPPFAAETFPEWRRILDIVDLDSLPLYPPPLQKPSEVFRAKQAGPTAEELAIAGWVCGIK